VSRSVLTAAILFAVFSGALFATRRAAGSSPIAWSDTFFDQQEVRECLGNDSCTLMGIGTSIPGLVHGVGWLEFRTVLAWAGLDLDGAHQAMQLLDALAIVLVFYLAMQLGGPLSAVLAVWILTMDIGTLGVRLTALNNSRALLFLGTVLVLACTAAVERPGMVSVTLAALVAAVMANIHSACVLTGASVMWVAALAPRRRALIAAWAAVAFAAAAFVIAPRSWLYDLDALTQQRVADHVATVGLDCERLIGWTLFALGAFAVSLVSRAAAAVEYRRRSQGALAVLLPFLAAFLIAPRFGIDANAKYLAHVKSACAIAAALPLGLVATAVLRILSARGLTVVECVLPFALAVALAVPTSLTPTSADELTPSMADLASTVQFLRAKHGWDLPRIVRSLKAPEGMLALEAIHQLGDASDPTGPAADDGAATAVLVRLEDPEIPQPLPSTWTVVRRNGRAAWMLIIVRSRIDWSAFEVCVRGDDGTEPSCEATGLRPVRAAHFSVANMPSAEARSRGTLALRLRLRQTRPGAAEEIFLPRLQNLCGGRIAGVSEESVRVDAERRSALLSGPDADRPAAIDLEWEILSPECDGTAYDGVPPFFLEGDAEDIRPLEAILRARESRR
jgi:hypothetical protein